MSLRLSWAAILIAMGGGCGRLGFEDSALASGDGGVDGDAPVTVTGFCAPASVPMGVTRLVCDDFESAATPFTNQFLLNGSWGLEAGQMLVKTDALVSGTTATVERSVVVPSSARRVRLGFDYVPEGVDTTDPVIAYFTFDDGANFRHDVEYVGRVAPQMAYIEDVLTPYGGAGVFNIFPFTGPTAGTSHRIEVAIDLDAPLLTSTLDGIEVLRTTPAVLNGGGSLRLAIGVPYLNGASQPWKVRLDNVALDAF